MEQLRVVISVARFEDSWKPIADEDVKVEGTYETLINMEVGVPVIGMYHRVLLAAIAPGEEDDDLLAF